MQSFSNRHGISKPAVPIVVREGAPDPLRQLVWNGALKAGANMLALSQFILDSMFYPHYRPERALAEMTENALMVCPWIEVYEMAEMIYANNTGVWRRHEDGRHTYQRDLNSLMDRIGIGWMMMDGKFEARGSASFENTVHQAEAALNEAGNATAENELRQAMQDLSRRPDADITGALQHAGAALECLARDICGDPKKTFGELVKAYPDSFPEEPLRTALEKIWGYASNNGRHLKEGHVPSFNQAMLIVGQVASLANYLVNENKQAAAPKK